MFQTILWILKIIGIILAAILGIVVLLIAVVLFLPVRYRIEANSEGRLKDSNVKVCFSWLFHLLAGHLIYQEGVFDWQVRIGWKRMNQSEESPREEMSVQIPAEKEETAKEARFETESVKIESSKTESSKTESVKTETKEKPKQRQRKKRRTSLFQKIKYTYQKICDKIKILSEKKEKVIEFLSDTVHQAAWERLKKEIRRILHFLTPKKIEGSICFGLEDPYNTGRILAFLSMLYPFYGEHIEIQPDFEHRVLKGELSIKGHLCGIYAMIPLWNLFWDKQVRATYQHVKTFKF